MSRELANRIAAGEVVERPGSVVKELVENSLDAGADRIAVTIEKSGIRLIKVTDNGCGMDEEDAVLAFEEHGTSKLADDKDLLSIGTLGFRGEAIPSIASVSRFTLKTRRRSAEAGVKVTVDAGSMISTLPDGCASGTTVEVRDLFYNVPARKKFLKTPATEEHHVEEVMMNLALGHYEQSFELRIDRRISFSSSGSPTPELRIRELFGRSFANNLLPVEHRENNMTVSGFIASPGFTRSGRREQRTFVNRRAVESQAIYRGIRDGYGTLSQESGRFPPAVLYIDIPPEEVDVNVHPAKKEVRFKSEYAVTRCIANAVSSALRRTAQEEIRDFGNESNAVSTLDNDIAIENIIGAAMVKYDVKKTEQQQLAFDDTTQENILSDQEGKSFFHEELPQETAPEETGNADPVPDKVPFFAGAYNKTEQQQPKTERIGLSRPYIPSASRPESAVFSGNWPTSVLGIWSDTYILCNSSEGLVIVDQHAAHERILYEKITSQVQDGSCASQMLLVPCSIELRNSEFRMLMNNREIFEKLGFEFEQAGGNTVLLSSIPLALAPVCRNPEDLIPEMIEELLMKQNTVSIPVDPDAAARAACHNAVRAHDVLTLREAEILIEDLKKCQQGTMCPHGRPTMITITPSELEKRFHRK